MKQLKSTYRELCELFDNENRFNVDSRFKSQLRYFEGSASMHYFREIFSLFPESFRPEKRKGFKAYDGLNNTFNFSLLHYDPLNSDYINRRCFFLVKI